MSLDITDRLYDRRMSPPDWEVCPDCKNEWEPHSSWCPTHPSEGYLALQAYYQAAEARDRGETNVEPLCPCCDQPYPNHVRGCAEAFEGEPSYRITPADFQPGGRHYEEDY